MAKLRKCRKKSTSAIASWALGIVQFSLLYANRFFLRMSQHAVKSTFGGFFRLFALAWGTVVFFKNLFTGLIPSASSRDSLYDGCRALVSNGLDALLFLPRAIKQAASTVQAGARRIKSSLSNQVQLVGYYLEAGTGELRALKSSTIRSISVVTSSTLDNFRRAQTAAQNRYISLKLNLSNLGENLMEAESRLRRQLYEKLQLYRQTLITSKCRGYACKVQHPNTSQETGWFDFTKEIFSGVVNTGRAAFNTIASALSGGIFSLKPPQIESVIVRGANQIAVRLKNTRNVIFIRLANIGYDIRSAVVEKTNAVAGAAQDGVTLVAINLKGTKDRVLIKLTDFGSSVQATAYYVKDRFSTSLQSGLLQIQQKGNFIKYSIANTWRGGLGLISATWRGGLDVISTTWRGGLDVISATCQSGLDVISATWRSSIGLIFNAGRQTGLAWNRAIHRITWSVSHVFYAPFNAFQRVQHTPCWLHMGVLLLLMSATYLVVQIANRFKRTTYALSLIPHNKIREGCKEFILSDSTLRKNMEKLHNQIFLGLNPKTKEQSSVKCWTTYVQDLPTGREKGQFLALDLGGTNFRVLLITLNGRHFDMQSKIYVVPQEIMTGPGDKLFDHIALCLDSFTKEQRVNDRPLPLGFTFSFPLQQVGLTKGYLTRWTKGFECSGVVGSDVVQGLRDAATRLGMKIDIVAILNDTTGTLMSCAWKNHNCKVGVILGTGTNACYVEKIENVIDFDGDHMKPHVLINTEWGAFGDKGELDFLLTPFDRDIDKNSINPGKQIHEKMIGGMYLGELVRLLLVKFIKDKVLFEGKGSAKIFERMSFKTEFISEVESDPRGIFKNCRNVLSKVHINEVTDQDCSNVRYICECISRRAAHLASAGIATLLNKMDIPSVTVGVDGSLYRFHPHFHDLMCEKISQLVNPSITNVNLMLSEDGSGRGAALIAAASTKS